MRRPLSSNQVQALRDVHISDVNVSGGRTYVALEAKGLIVKGGNRTHRIWRITSAGEIILAAHEEAIRLSGVGA